MSPEMIKQLDDRIEKSRQETRERAQRLSSNDQPVDELEKLVWWVFWRMRGGGKCKADEGEDEKTILLEIFESTIHKARQFEHERIAGIVANALTILLGEHEAASMTRDVAAKLGIEFGYSS